MGPIVLVLAVMGVLLVSTAAETQSQNKGAQKRAEGALVVTAAVEEGNIRPPLTLVGTAQPRYVAAVACEVAGRVENLAARKGDPVEKGDVLARQRTLPVNLRLRESRARLREVQSRIAKAKADLVREENLFAQKFTSEEQLHARRTDLYALREQEQRLRAAIRIVEDNLASMEIRAPFAGIVVEERTEAGQWLDEGDAVVVLADLSFIHVMVPVPEQHVVNLVRGDTVVVGIEALPDRDFSGTITAIVPQADGGSRAFPVQVEVENPDGVILSGMLARVTFHPVTHANALLVPKDALVPQPGGGGYVVKVADGKAAWVQVRILDSDQSRYAVVAVENDLAAGDSVVTRGNERLRPGQAVRKAASDP